MKDELDDADPMPFGKHKGSYMQDVPASYLLWLWYEGGLKNERDRRLTPSRLGVFQYIESNLNALHQECPDYVTN